MALNLQRIYAERMDSEIEDIMTSLGTILIGQGVDDIEIAEGVMIVKAFKLMNTQDLTFQNIQRKIQN